MTDQGRTAGATVGKKPGRARLVGLLALAMAAGAGATVFAQSSLQTFTDGETLTAAKLNGNFSALGARLAALETKEPFAGTAPAVWGTNQGVFSCGAPPETLPLGLGTATPPAVAYSDAFGRTIFTNGGAVSLNLSSPGTCGASATTVCAPPLTYFLVSPTDQTITIRAYLDDTGAVYVNGVRRAVAPTTAPLTVTVSHNATANTPFSVSFMGCSNNGATIGFQIYDAFISTYGLKVDYDTTFHRNGK